MIVDINVYESGTGERLAEYQHSMIPRIGEKLPFLGLEPSGKWVVVDVEHWIKPYCFNGLTHRVDTIGIMVKKIEGESDEQA